VLIMRFIFWRIRPGRVAAAGGGLLIGAGILLKPWLFLLLAIAGVWLFLQRSKAFLPAALMILFALPLPILLSNYHASVEDGGAVLSSSNSFSFYQSLDPDSWGTPRSLTPPVWTDQETADGFAHEALGRQLTDYEMSNYYLTTAQKRMIEGPLNFIGLVARKFSLLLSGHEVPDPVSPSFVFSNSAPYLIWGLYLFPLLLVFGLLGMTELQRSEQFPLLLTPVAALCVANLTGVYSCASRWPLMLVWLPLAVIGITVIKKLNPFGGSKPRYLMPALLIILIGSMLDLPGAQSKLENRSEDFRYEAALAAKSLDSRGASRLLREAVKSDPNNAMAQADLAKQFAEEDLYQAALEGFEKALSIDPSNKIALYELSELFRSQKEYGRAESLAVALVEDHPNHPLYLNQLGVIQMMQNRYADARISLRRALEILPDYQVAIINLREVERKERATASLAFPEEFSPLPGTPLLQFSEKVRVAQQQQDIAEFDRLTKEGLEEFPGHPFPLFLRGSYFMTMKRFQEAAAALTQVAQLVPGRFVLTQSAAQALYEVGRTDDARDLIKRNLEQAAGPDNKSRIQRLLELFDESINSGGTQ